ncbi:unnamed protein product [Larinioides sclopetarius]|uniref:Elongation of very long chain fatty acids protein n=1 Tax=Larinioides sclopetarius TaxID=280406 RepID=A0AAV2BMY3_9ARAC
MAFSSYYDFLSCWGFEIKLSLENHSIYPSIIICYILFSILVGPYLMQNRKAFSLRKILIAYNFFEVFINTYISYWTAYEMLKHKSFICVPRDDPHLLQAIEQNMPLWLLVFFNKTLELLDTVFFVLRKKKNQITFLHVVHHSGVCLLTWSCLRNKAALGGFYVPFGIAINCASHTVMYLYYGLSAIGPSTAKYLWWKKYITILQIEVA